MAKNYREIDDDTKSFVNEVAKRLGWHCEEMEVAEAKERRLMQEKESRPGVRGSSGGKKRKDASVVSVAGTKEAAASVKSGLLSQDAVTMVHQLTGMKAHFPTSAHPPGHPQVCIEIMIYDRVKMFVSIEYKKEYIKQHTSWHFSLSHLKWHLSPTPHTT